MDPQLKQILEKCEEKYKCEVLRCTTGRMMKGQEAWFAFRSRINASVLSEVNICYINKLDLKDFDNSLFFILVVFFINSIFLIYNNSIVINELC